ncbi:phosphatase (plasmid) [Sutcliffiella horikoshii]
MRKARRDYQREWRKNNPDKVKAYQKRFWEKKAKEKIANEA